MSNLAPANLEDLRASLAAAHARRERIEAIDLRAFDRVVDYEPEDMTATVEAGLTLAAFQERLAQRGQWLPIDPPEPHAATVGAILATNASGPRRFGYGTIREHLLGLKVVLADGRLIRSGGRVVKNVAGYDLQKLFIGARGTLGVIVEATFKVRPLPAAERFLAAPGLSFEEAAGLMKDVLDSPMAPVVLDLHRPAVPSYQPLLTLVLGFAGTPEEVEWQASKAIGLCDFRPTTLEYDERFWAEESAGPARRLSVLPAQVAEAARALGAVDLLARAGNGVIYFRGGSPPPKGLQAQALAQRLKDTFDPHHVFPELPS